MDKEQLVSMLRMMIRIRKFETRVAELYAQGKIPGFVHLYIGEEAVATGTCANLRTDDFITST
ncbi:MAG: pyruvate dehydrogenase (acetyl-transferring) E1 component subunit alpha, partial [Firmicutes bacterium]|nr:pyruvate dehydrogenase (acetyl-transferring) E1 component subunit alpha [Bacillota bacterium]